MKLVRSALIAAMLAPAGGALGQASLEVIPLRHATADEVVPALRPLLEPGATLTGQSNQLIIRASPGNIAELRRALEAIDRPRTRLQVSVRFEDAHVSANQGIAVSGRAGGAGGHVELRAQDSRTASEERVDQRLQMLEGARAYIATGQSRPQPYRQIIRTPAGVVAQDTYVVQEMSSGFEVSPRIAGDRVLVDVYAQREKPAGMARGAVDSQRVLSSVSARLGEWFELGGVDESAARDHGGIASSSGARSGGSRKVWMKVEALPR